MVGRWVLGLALAGLIAGCGGPEDSNTPDEPDAAAPGATATATSNSTSKACDVLTQADAAAALGREVKKLDAGTAAGAAAGLEICQFGYQGEKLMDMGQASVTLQAVDLASLRKGVEDQGWATEPVAGLGDAAFWSKDAGLYVGKGNRSAIYLVGGGGITDAKERSIALAKATIGRL